MSFPQAGTIMRDTHLDPGFSTRNTLLAVPQQSHPGLSLDNSNPIARFYTEDAPWSTERMRGQKFSFFPPPPMEYRPYPQSIGSEGESLARASDSGYRTLTSMTSPSPFRNDHDRTGHEFASDVPFQVENSPVASDDPLLPHHGGPSPLTDGRSQYSGRSGARSSDRNREIRCPDCSEVSRCKSDHKCVQKSHPARTTNDA